MPPSKTSLRLTSIQSGLSCGLGWTQSSLLSCKERERAARESFEIERLTSLDVTGVGHRASLNKLSVQGHARRQHRNQKHRVALCLLNALLLNASSLQILSQHRRRPFIVGWVDWGRRRKLSLRLIMHIGGCHYEDTSCLLTG